MKPVELPCFGITVTPATITDKIGRRTCAHCGEPDCCYSCSGSTEGFTDGPKTEPAIEKEEQVAARLMANGAMDGITSLILACHCAGIDVDSPAFLEAIETAVGAVENNA